MSCFASSRHKTHSLECSFKDEQDHFNEGKAQVFESAAGARDQQGASIRKTTRFAPNLEDGRTYRVHMGRQMGQGVSIHFFQILGEDLLRRQVLVPKNTEIGITPLSPARYIVANAIEFLLQ